MTCIVALRTAAGTFMAADSMSGSPADYSVSPTKSRKIVRVGDMLIGFSTSWRMGQLVTHPDVAARLQDRRDEGFDSDDDFPAVMVDIIRETLKHGGFAKVEHGVEQGGDFMVIRGGRIYTVHSDYSVHEPEEGFTAIGCGAQFALGYLHAAVPSMKSEHFFSDPESVLRGALGCAERYSMGVRGPFHVMQWGE